MSDCPARGPVKAVVFDFDGTLAELTIDFDVMRQGVAAVAGRYFASRPEPDSLPVLEWVENLRLLLAEEDRGAAADFFRACHELIKDMEMEGAARGRLFSATRPLLRSLAASGVACGVITRNCADAVLRVFPDMAEHCGCFLARDHVTRVKPDPEHLLTALTRLGCPPERGLMIGDHPMDVHTGIRAGTLTAGVAGGRMSEEDLRRAGALVTAPNLEELAARLKQAGLLDV